MEKREGNTTAVRSRLLLQGDMSVGPLSAHVSTTLVSGFKGEKEETFAATNVKSRQCYSETNRGTSCR